MHEVGGLGISSLCRFSGMGDDFREEGLFSVQTHNVPGSTYHVFMYIHVQGNGKEMKEKLQNFQLIKCAPSARASCELDPQSNFQHIVHWMWCTSTVLRFKYIHALSTYSVPCESGEGAPRRGRAHATVYTSEIGPCGEAA
jgi:hypothetical protein